MCVCVCVCGEGGGGGQQRACSSDPSPTMDIASWVSRSASASSTSAREYTSESRYRNALAPPSSLEQGNRYT